MAKKKRVRKDRSEFIQGTTANKVDHIDFEFDIETGEIAFKTEMVNRYTEVSYKRAKAPKVIARTPAASGGSFFRTNQTLLNNFDFIVAIDTNTKSIREHQISVSGIIFCMAIFAVDTKGIAYKAWRIWNPFCMEFMNVKSQPEIVGWIRLISLLENSAYYKDFTRVAIIVDYDLGKINKFNTHELPIWGPIYLPKRIQLVYASADTGADLLPNQLIRSADKYANIILKELESGRAELNTKLIQGAPYSGYRMIILKHESYS